MKKLLALLLAVVMVFGLVACAPAGDGEETKGSTGGAETTGGEVVSGGSVYYLNFKPEQDQAWQDLAKA